jgi:hypothetical protein
MSEQKANQDYRYPMAETFLYGPVTTGSFTDSDKLPIFWGPGQFTTSYPDYSPPDPDRWRLYEHLNIPRVARFIYGNDDVTDDDEYSDDDSGGGGDPEPFQCPGFIYETTPAGVQIRVRRSTAFNPNDPFDSGPYQLEFITGSCSIKWYNTTLNVIEPYSAVNTVVRTFTGTKGIDDVTEYEGIAKDCPRLICIPGRQITWYQICKGGGVPEGGSKNFISTGYYPLKEKSTDDPSSVKPRCSITLQSNANEPDFYVPLDDPFQGRDPNMVYSEVIDIAKSWYGCDDPGGPRNPPTSPTPFPVP